MHTVQKECSFRRRRENDESARKFCDIWRGKKSGIHEDEGTEGKGRQNGRHILLLCPGGNFDGGRRSERFSVRFQRAADPCCRDEAAEKPLPVNQGQLWLCADRYLPVFLFRRSDCGGDDLRRKEKDVWTAERVEGDLRHAAAGPEKWERTGSLEEGDHCSEREAGGFLRHSDYRGRY